MKPIKDTRFRIRAARRAVAPADRERWNRAICQRVLDLEFFQHAEKVSGFLAFDGEADPLDLMAEAENLGKQVYVPTIIAKHQPLMFVPWSVGCELAKNQFGILEPVVARPLWIAASELDFVINPLVAFDESCNRIGVGGGYYDRSFAFLHDADSLEASSKTQLVGFAFELQKIEPIQANPWDISLHGVVTEKKLYRPCPKK